MGKRPYGRIACNRVYKALIRANRPCTSRELSQFMGVTLDHVADVLLALHDSGRVERYKPLVANGRAPFFYFPTGYRIDAGTAKALSDLATRKCMKSVSRMACAWDSIGGWFTIEDFAKTANVSYESAQFFISKKKKTGLARKRWITRDERAVMRTKALTVFRKVDNANG